MKPTNKRMKVVHRISLKEGMFIVQHGKGTDLEPLVLVGKPVTSPADIAELLPEHVSEVMVDPDFDYEAWKRERAEEESMQRQAENERIRADEEAKKAEEAARERLRQEEREREGLRRQAIERARQAQIAEEAARKKAEEEAKRRKKDEEEQRHRAQARKKAEQAARKQAALEAEKRALAEAKDQEEERKRARAEAEKTAKIRAEQERRKAEEQRRKLEELERKKAEAEARRLALERKKAEQAARKQAEEKQRKAEEARRKAEEERRRLEEKRRQELELTRKKALAEARRLELERNKAEAEKAAREKAEKEAKRNKEEAKRLAELAEIEASRRAEAKRRQAAAEQQKAETIRQKAKAAANRKAEQERKQEEEKRKKEEEARKQRKAAQKTAQAEAEEAERTARQEQLGREAARKTAEEQRRKKQVEALRNQLPTARKLYRAALRFMAKMFLAARQRQKFNPHSADPLLKALLRTARINPSALTAVLLRDGKSDYAVSHSVNVGVLSLAFGSYLGLPEARIRQLGLAALFHDIGRARIPMTILEKPGRLTDKERQLVRSRPATGANMLRELGEQDGVQAVEPEVIRAVREHHERHDGSGYPDGLAGGLEGQAICETARILAVADIFDAMTTKTAYRTPQPPPKILGRMYQWSGTLFDPEVAERFIKFMGIYPVGSLVRLSGGRFQGLRGVVMAVQPRAPLRPTVRFCLDAALKPLHPELLHLSAKGNEAVSVSEYLDPVALGVDVLALMR